MKMNSVGILNIWIWISHLPGFVTIISLPTDLNVCQSSLSRRFTVIP